MMPYHWDDDLVSAAAVLVAVVVLTLLSFTIQSATSAKSGADATDKGIQLLAQSQEWSRISEQDQVPLYALRHAIFAHAFLTSARAVCSDAVLQRQGIDVNAYAARLELAINNATKKINKSCAAANPKKASPPAVVSWL